MRAAGDPYARDELRAGSAQVTQTTASTTTARDAATLCQTAILVSRRTDSVMTTSTAATTRAATRRRRRSRRSGRTIRGRTVRPSPKQAPVEQRVERPAERRHESHVGELHDGQQAERNAQDHGRRRSGPRRQQQEQGDGKEALHRNAHERAEAQPAEIVRYEQGREDHQAGQHAGHRPPLAISHRQGSFAFLSEAVRLSPALSCH